ncbi:MULTISPECIES: hypothetical protein [unclassified Rhodococcus (in: high G+C Gram-positive bacteria)]|uniref:hypothetical protein n=1 Tax=unclassified Rhodococcus (in: high G+C Gram-positive bacteria) TaxID=192944 RepID=UPI00096AA9DA|nr:MULTISPECIES: hypothetical protein [unclassified Rhodococcus (in: high G+C Gram-positive bacteria)]
MGEFGPVPVGDNGIDIPAILQGSPIPGGGYLSEVGGEPVRITVNRRCVDDDGTFVVATGNRMLQFVVTGAVLRPSTAVDVVRGAAPVSLGAIYIYVSDVETTQSIYVVAAFFSDSGSMIDAPPEFDWWKHSNLHRDFSVHRIGGTLDALMPVYRSLNHRFYLPHMDRRGRYWKLCVVRPPESSGLGATFAATVSALSRRSAISSDIKPLALEWLHDGIALFTFQRIRKQRCFQLEIDLPDHNQMTFGGFFLPAGGPIIREPAQFAAGLTSRLRELSAASYSLMGTECDCIE